MSRYNHSNKVQDFSQYNHFSHLKTADYEKAVKHAREDYESSLIRRMEKEVRELGLPRSGYRKPRAFHTMFGTIWLKIPRVKGVNYTPSFINPHSPFDSHLLYAIQSMYLSGMSQRAITSYLCEVHGLVGVTRRQVQTAIHKIIVPGLKFLERDLSKTYYPVIYVDSHYTPIREGNIVVKKAVMIAIGRKTDGNCEVLGMDVQTSEAASNYSLFFEKLFERGLQSPEILVSDEHKGLRLAIRLNFPLCLWRRCNFHVLKTAGQLSSFDSEFLTSLSQALLQDKHQAIIFDTFSVLNEYREDYPEAVTLIEENLVDLKNFYPGDKLSDLTATNNISESLNSLIRSRTDSVRVFPHLESYNKLVGNLLIAKNSQWNQKSQLNEEEEAEILERKDWRAKEVLKSLESTSFLSSSNVHSPCIIWLDEIFEDVSINYVNISLGTLFLYGCDSKTGKRVPLAFEYILDDREKTLRNLIKLFKDNFNTSDLFLIVVPMSLAKYKQLFELNFPGACWQLDIPSFIERISNIVPKKEREAFNKRLNELYKLDSLKAFKVQVEKFIKDYSMKFPRAIEEFKKYVSQTMTFLDFNLPRSRINRVKHMLKALKKDLSQGIENLTERYMPYPTLTEYDQLLTRSFEKELNSVKNKAYIRCSKLRQYC